MSEPSLFRNAAVEKTGQYVPYADLPTGDVGAFLRTETAGLPRASELDVVRHFTRLSRCNFSVDTHFYPLGSCTMKYNPRIGEQAAESAVFANLHPCVAEEDMQGALELIHSLGRMLCYLTAMDGFTPQPAAGAQGEYTGMAMIRSYFEQRGEERPVVLIPDSAHGTNPASARMQAFEVQTIPSGRDGLIDLEALRAAMSERVAALMLTNPNTLGLFEKQILEAAHLVHDAGGLLYYDGANLNAIAGVVRPGDMGFDVVHLNLHKTFATPHGGGGPGSGPVLCKAPLTPFLPAPLVQGGEQEPCYLDWREEQPSIGMVRSFYGQLPVLVRAFTYLTALGLKGVRAASLHAVLNANYLKEKLRSVCAPAFAGYCMHEFVVSLKNLRDRGLKASDIAKALIDRGIHPPTVYFPLIVAEAFMIEPTETESRATLDRFVEAMQEIMDLAERDPQAFADFPVSTAVSRLDEVRAVKQPQLRD